MFPKVQVHDNNIQKKGPIHIPFSLKFTIASFNKTYNNTTIFYMSKGWYKAESISILNFGKIGHIFGDEKKK